MFSKKNFYFQNNKVNIVTFIFKLFLRIVVVWEFVFKAHSLESLKTFSSFFLEQWLFVDLLVICPTNPLA